MYGDFKKIHISYMAIFVTPPQLYVPPPQNIKKNLKSCQFGGEFHNLRTLKVHCVHNSNVFSLYPIIKSTEKYKNDTFLLCGHIVPTQGFLTTDLEGINLTF